MSDRVHAVLMAVLAIAVALAVAGCGDDSDGDKTAGSSDVSGKSVATAPSDTEGKRPKADQDRASRPGDSDASEAPSRSRGEDERAVATAVERMYADLTAGDATGVCAAMSSNAREQIAQQVPGGSAAPPAERSCAASMSKFLEAAANSGVLERTFDASVQSVDVAGDNATVKVSLGGKAGNIALVKEDGKWVFGAGPVAQGGTP